MLMKRTAKVALRWVIRNSRSRPLVVASSPRPASQSKKSWARPLRGSAASRDASSLPCSVNRLPHCIRSALQNTEWHHAQAQHPQGWHHDAM